MPERLEDQTVARLARHHGGPGRAALAHTVPAVQIQLTAQLRCLVRMTFVSVVREHGPNLLLEEFRTGILGHGRPRSVTETARDRKEKTHEGLVHLGWQATELYRAPAPPALGRIESPEPAFSKRHRHGQSKRKRNVRR